MSTLKRALFGLKVNFDGLVKDTIYTNAYVQYKVRGYVDNERNSALHLGTPLQYRIRHMYVTYLLEDVYILQ